MQPEGKFCQSCGMPLIKKEDHGTEADHTQSEKYCHYCYKDGKFTGPDTTQEEMVEISAKGWAESDPNVSYEEAKTHMKTFIPYLERWKKN